MKENKITIIINKSIDEVFEFTINPKNTPLWIESIAEEVSDEYPPKINTKYKNRGKDSDWNVYKVVEFKRNKIFTLTESIEVLPAPRKSIMPKTANRNAETKNRTEIIFTPVGMLSAMATTSQQSYAKRILNVNVSISHTRQSAKSSPIQSKNSGLLPCPP